MRFIWLIVLVCAGAMSAAAQTRISGKVTDANANPIEFASVVIVGTTTGTLTDENGRFTLTTTFSGTVKLRASAIGYAPKEQMLVLGENNIVVDFCLEEEGASRNEIVVSASAYSAGDNANATLGALDVVTTPGAAADIFRAIQALPGVARVDDSAGLFVRGGDVSETLTLLDQATVTYPYRFQTPQTGSGGGLFGTIPPFLVSGTVFSSGGFSARYGNALSAVIAMESNNLPKQTSLTLNAGLGALSLGAQVQLADNLGVRFSGNYGLPRPMFALNNQLALFERLPEHRDGNVSLIYRYSPSGQLKIFNYLTRNQVGVRATGNAQAGIYLSDEQNSLHNLQWSDLLSGWLVKTSLSLNRFSVNRQFGVLNVTQGDDTYKLRADIEGDVAASVKIAFGAEVEHIVNRYAGVVPITGNWLSPSAETLALNERYSGTRFGGYAEVEWAFAKNFILTTGLRTDHHLLAKETVFDPRASVRYRLTESLTLSAAWGIYHQFAQPFQFAPIVGNPNLQAQSAQHFILGAMYDEDALLIRLEAYYKPYRNLIVADKELNLSNRGVGFAQGVDFFLKYGGFLKTPVSGWISYSYLRSERTQARRGSEGLNYEVAPAPFDITHNFVVVSMVRIWGGLHVGATLRLATGRPITPIVGSIFRDGSYSPIDGAVGSERLPDFSRLDLNANYYLPFGNHSVVFYAEVSNALDRENVLGYQYSEDFSMRSPVLSTFRRFWYFGATLALSL
ncbi:MAG: TonB-dependent receptor [Chloroherpetonaceae bacterium]|nr:TonB-dependent receptor [Chloroherpetonaceae bacterium]